MPPRVTYPESAIKLPTIVVNRFAVLAGPQSVRITVGEQVATDVGPTYHQAFVMTHADARWLCDLIEQQIANIETPPRPGKK